MRFRVRFQDPQRDTENLIECDTLDEAHVAYNAIRRYVVYLGTIHMPILHLEYRPSDQDGEWNWKAVPQRNDPISMHEVASEFIKHLNSRFN